MPDWQELVSRRLAGLELDYGEKEEVQVELATHLEESYERFRKQGLLERESVNRALEQVSDWQELGDEIFAAKRRKHPMKKRARQLWIPGFLALILSTLLLMTLQGIFGVRPRIVGSRPGAILFYVPLQVVYAPWLASLPVIGALGGYISSRAGGSRGMMVLSSVFPALAFAGAFLLMSPIGMLIERVIGRHNDFGVVATVLLSNWVGCIVAPGAALLVGGLLVQLFFGQRLSTQRPQPVGEAENA